MTRAGGGHLKISPSRYLGYTILMWFAKERGGRKQDAERFAALEKAIEAQDSTIRLLKMEWESVFDKMSRLMGRLNARIRKSEATNGSENDEPEVPQPAAPPRFLSHAQMQEVRNRRGLLPR